MQGDGRRTDVAGNAPGLVVEAGPERDHACLPGVLVLVADTDGEMPEVVRRNVELWIGCVAGALEEAEYRAGLEGAGFEEVSLEPTRIHGMENAKELLAEKGLDIDEIASDIDGRFMSATVRARKPVTR